ncbi:helix-turn-helix domain-containing protein [Renibacterium salmoninarum]|nr:helix-turn-helix transcriptional regulator [Renibacterium salmoninarum]
MQLKSANTLRALMGQEDISLGALALRARCSKGFISHLLAGRRSSCTPALGVRIANALNVPVRVLFDITQDVQVHQRIQPVIKSRSKP